MINTSEANEVLVKMLNASRFDFEDPVPKIAWIAFKKFCNIKVKCADDSLLFQCGVFNFTGEDLFHFELVRQFVIETDGEYDHMEQLSISLFFKPNSELSNLETNIWSNDCNSIDDFFAKVETINSFTIPIDKYLPLRCELSQEVI